MSTHTPGTADPDRDLSVLDRLQGLATAVLNEHTNDRGLCAACADGVPFPCEWAVVAEHNAALR
jgi:hypothetical protein